MAARKAGLSTVPVYVLAATAADTAAETIDRIVHQIVTNDQKQDLSNAQRARGIQQMIDAGLTAQKVAKIHRTKANRRMQMNSPSLVSPAGRF
jgi:ParB family chromosome partitioning protein